MDVFWTQENLDEKALIELGSEMHVVADLFPRVVQAIYVQLHNGELHQASTFTREEFQSRVLAELPKSCEEVLPFFVRAVWNRKWHPQTHENDIADLAESFARVVHLAGGQVTQQELVEECKKSFV